MKGSSLKHIAIYGGVALITLALIDTAFQYKESGFGRGVKTQALTESTFIILLLGMIIGMVGGIVMAFSYFIWKEKKLAAEPDELTQLLDELNREEALFHKDSSNSKFENDEKGDRLEPWERPTDWWKRDED